MDERQPQAPAHTLQKAMIFTISRVWSLPPLLNLLLGSCSSPRNNLEMSESLGRSFFSLPMFFLLLANVHTRVASCVIFLGSNSICFSNAQRQGPSHRRICLFRSKGWWYLQHCTEPCVALGTFSCQTGTNASLKLSIFFFHTPQRSSPDLFKLIFVYQ